jgi:hypothetical protein
MRSSLEDSRGLDPSGTTTVTQGLVAHLGRQSEGSSQLESLQMPPSRRCSGPRRKKWMARLTGVILGRCPVVWMP